MDIKLEKQLSDRFTFMKGRDLCTGNPNGESIYTECSDGWYQLIYDLCTELEQWYIDNGQDQSKINVWQIKEKFGELRFYADTYKDAYKIIDRYENKSTTICERCGRDGKLRTDMRWIQTLCDECVNK